MCCNFQVSVYVPKDHIDQAEFALNMATEILDMYENFFGEKYPLKKQGNKQTADVTSDVAVNTKN